MHEADIPFENKIRVSASVPITKHDPHSISETLTEEELLGVLHVKNEALQKLTEASPRKVWVQQEDHSHPQRAGVGGLTCYAVHQDILFATRGPFNRVVAVPDDKVE